MNPNPIVALNRAVATAMVQGPSIGLQRIDEIARDPKMKNNYRIDAARGHLYERAGEFQLAAEYFRKAAQGTASLPEKNYLLGKAARVRASGMVESHSSRESPHMDVPVPRVQDAGSGRDD
jgi:predicted RNA polymerase sigma factor